MEDVRTYGIDEEDHRRDDDRVEFEAASSDDEVPFHVPRD